MTAPELKPCPWCNGTDTTIEGRGQIWRGVKGYSAPQYFELRHFGRLSESDEFPRCHVVFRHRTEAEAIAAWNTRAHDPDLEAHIGAVLAEAAEQGADIAQRTRPEGMPYEASMAYHTGAMDVVDAIRALNTSALTALDRAIEAALLEDNKNNEDWFGVVHDLWSWVIDQPGGMDAPMQEGAADAVVENFKAAISAMLREARMDGMEMVLKVAACKGCALEIVDDVRALIAAEERGEGK